MKNSYILLILITFLFACSVKQNNSENSDSKTNELVKQIVDIAAKYATSQLKDSVKTSTGDGITWISDNQKMYEIDPNKTFYGLVDADSAEDAIVTLTSFIGQEPGIPEHLILINKNGKLMLAKSIEMDMKILSLKDRFITGEIHTKPRSSPLYNCEKCMAIVKYKFENGDTIKIN
jgi:hypothetical protein